MIDNLEGLLAFIERFIRLTQGNTGYGCSFLRPFLLDTSTDPFDRELLQIFARFNLEQKRASLEDMTTKRGLYPHGAARTFQIGADGRLNKVR